MNSYQPDSVEEAMNWLRGEQVSDFTEVSYWNRFAKLNAAIAYFQEKDPSVLLGVQENALRTRILQTVAKFETFYGALSYERVEALFKCLSLNFDREAAIQKIVVHTSSTKEADAKNGLLVQLLEVWLPHLDPPMEGGSWVYHNGRPAVVSITGTKYGDDLQEVFEPPSAIPVYQVLYTYPDGSSETTEWVGMFTAPGEVLGLDVIRS